MKSTAIALPLLPNRSIKKNLSINSISRQLPLISRFPSMPIGVGPITKLAFERSELIKGSDLVFLLFAPAIIAGHFGPTYNVRHQAAFLASLSLPSLTFALASITYGFIRQATASKTGTTTLLPNCL